jgi:hypothetical protein
MDRLAHLLVRESGPEIIHDDHPRPRLGRRRPPPRAPARCWRLLGLGRLGSCWLRLLLPRWLMRACGGAAGCGSDRHRRTPINWEPPSSFLNFDDGRSSRTSRSVKKDAEPRPVLSGQPAPPTPRATARPSSPPVHTSVLYQGTERVRSTDPSPARLVAWVASCISVPSSHRCLRSRGSCLPTICPLPSPAQSGAQVHPLCSLNRQSTWTLPHIRLHQSYFPSRDAHAAAAAAAASGNHRGFWNCAAPGCRDPVCSVERQQLTQT